MTDFTTHPSQYRHLRIERLSPLIGANVHDVNLSDLSDDSLRGELRRSLAEFQVLFFRKQSLTPEQQIRLAQVFGDPAKAKAFFPRLSGHETVEVIETAPNVPKYGVDQWHADITFYHNPPTGTVLYSRKIPPLGGDTAWSSATAAYDLVPGDLKPWLEKLKAVHSFENSGWPAYFEQLTDGKERYAKARAEYLPVEHPVVRIHPVTGRKILYVNPNFTDRIKGLPRNVSESLLKLLFGLFDKPETQTRLRWEVDTVAIWDNRATVHYALSDYVGERLLHRVTFGEDAAF